MNHSAIICDETIESYNEKTKTIPKRFNENEVICRMQNVYILLTILLITIALLIAASIHCYLIKYGLKQKQLLPFYDTNKELREVLY